MITRLLVGILTPAMRAIHPSPFRQRSMCEIKCRGNRLDVRWRPALVENRERTQKVPRARKWRRDPERLRDERDVEPNLCLSSKKRSSAEGGHGNVIIAMSWRLGRNRPPGHRRGHSRRVFGSAGRSLSLAISLDSLYRRPKSTKITGDPGPLASEEFPYDNHLFRALAHGRRCVRARPWGRFEFCRASRG